MIGEAPKANELLGVLAGEVRQTLYWISQEGDRISRGALRERLQRLREAALAAGLPAVEAGLASLDPAAPAPAASDPGWGAGDFEELQRKLTALAVALSESASGVSRLWLARLQRLERSLNGLQDGLLLIRQQQEQIALLADRCATCAAQTERTALLGEIGKLNRDGGARTAVLLERIRHLDSDLRETRRTIAGLWDGAQRILLAPALAPLREQVRQLGKELGKPLSLQVHCADTSLGPGQVEPLQRVILTLSGNMLREGIEDPRERRSSGKASVGSLRLTAHNQGGLLQVLLEDDGRRERPRPTCPPAIVGDLRRLRARLLLVPGERSGWGLLLQFPCARDVLQVLPLSSGGLEILVPLLIVSRTLDRGEGIPAGLPILASPDGSVANRQGDEAGLVLALQGGEALLPGKVSLPVQDVFLSPADPEDPPWIWGRDKESDPGRPILHPLAWWKPGARQLCLFPAGEA
jgi:hypothetical protein